MPLIERCICDGRIFRAVEAFGLSARECRVCFTLHQHVAMTPDDLSRWYRETYHNGVYGHTYAHDADVARKRMARYGTRLRGPVLDVGCGNGAFVDACRDAGIEAEGQDIGGGSARHAVPLDAVEGSFETVTMHDVLEHAVDPVGMLRSARRILNRGGWLMVDFPDFFHEAGAHHWKPVEHLWMLSGRQLERMIEDAGFRVRERDRPVPGKIVIYAT